MRTTLLKLSGIVVVAGLVSAPAFLSAQAPHRWVDENGDVLPFQTDEQIEDFLRAARVTDKDDIGIGVTDPIRVKLAQGDTEVHGVFRYMDKTYDRVRMEDGRVRMNLRDNCHYEVAAYKLSRLLGMDSVPPTVSRRVGADNGTLQIWVYDAMMEAERSEQGLSAPSRMAFTRQVHQMYLFDALIGNDDRTAQNLLIDQEWKIWLIDHTRAFYDQAQSANLAKATFVERGFWEGLQGLDKATLTASLEGILAGYEIDQLLERRDKVAAHLRGLIDTRGEGAVVYDLAPARH